VHVLRCSVPTPQRQNYLKVLNQVDFKPSSRLPMQGCAAKQNQVEEWSIQSECRLNFRDPYRHRFYRESLIFTAAHSTASKAPIFVNPALACFAISAIHESNDRVIVWGWHVRIATPSVDCPFSTCAVTRDPRPCWAAAGQLKETVSPGKENTMLSRRAEGGVRRRRQAALQPTTASKAAQAMG
jgi:hypothetical protein